MIRSLHPLPSRQFLFRGPRPARTSRQLAVFVVMVEGHQCHRVAHAHRRLLVGQAFEATSPNGRFVEGAAALDQKPLTRIEVHGKYLFYFFARPNEPETVLHFHFGMSGAFRTMALPGVAPTPTTRLRLVSRALGIAAHLSAMTVLHGGVELYHEKIAKLGPDPLREDADKELLWAKMRSPKCKKSIGLVLMDQAFVAGLGNIYRAEVLFKCGVHPEQPAGSITRPEFEQLWHHSTDLLQRGFAAGSILTVDPAEAAVLGRPWTRRYIYNQSKCGRCKGVARTWDMGGRTVHACETCQPLRALAPAAAATAAAASAAATAAATAATAAGQNVVVSKAASADGVSAELLTPARVAALRAATPARVFRSHCAADDPADPVTPAKMTVAELRAALQERGLPSTGLKKNLIAQLTAACECAPSSSPAAAAGTDGEGGDPAADSANLADAVPLQRGKRRRKAGQAATAGGTPSGTSGGGGHVLPRTVARRKRGKAGGHVAAHQMDVVVKEEEEGGGSDAEGGEEGSGDELDRLEGLLTRSMAVPKVMGELPDAPSVTVGTRHIKHVASAWEAALEKRLAGESRGVEHVAMPADDVAAAVTAVGDGSAAGPSGVRAVVAATAAATAAAASVAADGHEVAGRDAEVEAAEVTGVAARSGVQGSRVAAGKRGGAPRALPTRKSSRRAV